MSIKWQWQRVVAPSAAQQPMLDCQYAQHLRQQQMQTAASGSSNSSDNSSGTPPPASSGDAQVKAA